MRILLAHNFYRSSAPSGEDAVFRNEREMLLKHQDVISFERYNDDIDDSTLMRKIRLVKDGTWSRQTYDELNLLIRAQRPDIAHFHNTFPQISPSAYAACQDNGVPVVQTLHNYRLVCPNALLMRDGKPCEDCIGKNLWPAIRYRCYRNSLSATAAQVWMLVRNRLRGSYLTLVNRYIALTDFAAGRMIAGGFPAERISVKPNFLPEPPCPGEGDGGYAIFVGRLSEEKGIRTLLTAWQDVSGMSLKLVGDGPLKDEVVSWIGDKPCPVEWLGYLGRDRILELVRNARLLIVPSLWYEGFPMVVLEAYACGTPVVASNIGSLSEVVWEGTTGFKFEAGNAADLARVVNGVLSDGPMLTKLREKVRSTFDEHYSEPTNYKQLMSIYEQTL